MTDDKCNLFLVVDIGAVSNIASNKILMNNITINTTTPRTIDNNKSVIAHLAEERKTELKSNAQYIIRTFAIPLSTLGQKYNEDKLCWLVMMMTMMIMMMIIIILITDDVKYYSNLYVLNTLYLLLSSFYIVSNGISSEIKGRALIAVKQVFNIFILTNDHNYNIVIIKIIIFFIIITI